jgi:hypothetical protein
MPITPTCPTTYEYANVELLHMRRNLNVEDAITASLARFRKTNTISGCANDGVFG